MSSLLRIVLFFIFSVVATSTCAQRAIIVPDETNAVADSMAKSEATVTIAASELADIQ